MAPFQNKTIVLSLTVAVFTAVTLAGPSSNGGGSGCSDLASRQGANISYTDVVKCFDSIPFNREAAKTTLESVTRLFNDYYISRDAAMTPFLVKPLEGDPVDIVAKFKMIGRTRYTSDRKFHTDIHQAIESLHDGHAIYFPYCYMAYEYGQPLSLYAPVINGKQVLKVYQDDKRRGYEDCTVRKIDGKSAMTQVKKRADVLFNSKDPNVRLNEALASITYNPQLGAFVVSPGSFATRELLPDNPSMRYELQCSHSKRPIFVEDEWVIRPQLPWNFTDTASYIKNVCLSQPTTALPSPPSAGTSRKRDLGNTSFKQHATFSALNKRAIVTEHKPQAASPALPSIPPSAPVYPEAIKIGAGNCTVFHQLKDRPSIGILTLFVTTLDFAEVEFMSQSLETLYQRGVTDIIIDVVGGNGGYANVASDFVQLLFPTTDPLDKIIPVRFRSTPAIQQLSAKVFNSTDGGWSRLGNMLSIAGGAFYDSSRFWDMDNSRMYSDNSLFTDTVTQTLFLLTHQFGVKSYGVGGTKGEALSKYQYVAGAGTMLETFNGIFAFANMTSPIKDLPYQGVLAATIGELIAPGSSVPLEFDPAKHPTDFRLDFDPVNARSREALWTQVAKAAWR
ncbi:hypothetical protein BGZ97_005890 [Linnemannia gamsii]|uniref:Tail specific protease domain-containing protein n=1 Tax=Linnemannia gamsii TaxID=64522 RepID=A0A9P6REB6_9FUNG|nr:hypothetical protein BGZ97_005890 [Linnemannia gamsii]